MINYLLIGTIFKLQSSMVLKLLQLKIVKFKIYISRIDLK